MTKPTYDSHVLNVNINYFACTIVNIMLIVNEYRMRNFFTVCKFNDQITKMCYSDSETKLFDSLSRPLENANVHESLWNDKCNYLDISDCASLNPNSLNMVTLQLNIRTLISNQTDFKITPYCS